MLLQVIALLPVFFGRLVGQRPRPPDLPVRMGVGAAHNLSLILEHLHPAVASAQLRRLGRPHVHHGANSLDGHLRQRQVVTGRKADHAAGALLAFRPKQGVGSGGRFGCVRQERGEVVGKDVGAFVRGVALGCPRSAATGALVARAQVAGRIVPRAYLRGRLLHLATPGALGAVRRHEQPFARQWVVAAVGMVGGVKWHDTSPSTLVKPARSDRSAAPRRSTGTPPPRAAATGAADRCGTLARRPPSSTPAPV